MRVAREVDAVADEIGASSTQVAVAWVQAQGYKYIPIVGARRVEQIVDSLGAAEIMLDEAHLQRLEEASRVQMGFPHDFLAVEGVRDLVYGELRTRLDGPPKDGRHKNNRL